MTRDYRERIRRFADNHSRRTWVSFFDIADWCSQLTGKKAVKPEVTKRLRQYVYLELATSYEQGFFESTPKGKIPKALYLCADARDCQRLDIGFLTERQQTYADRFVTKAKQANGFDIVIKAYLANIWVPIGLCRRWFEASKITPPTWLSGQGAASPCEGTSLRPRLRKRPVGTEEDDVEAIEDMHLLRTRNQTLSVRAAADMLAAQLGYDGQARWAVAERLRKKYRRKFRPK